MAILRPLYYQVNFKHRVSGLEKFGKKLREKKCLTMIQIAIISDIHANIVALEEVLKDLDRKSITQIFCLGDLVDFAPWGNEVIAMIRKKGIPSILGNHDERIAFDQPIVPLAHHDEEETAYRAIAINFSKKTITNANKKWLTSLPYHLEVSYKINNTLKTILLVHASPGSNDEYIYESDPKEGIMKALNDKAIDALVMGHTHVSYIRNQSNILIVNCGSVGRSKEKDRKATYTILNIADDRIHAEIVKLEYQIELVTKAIYESEIPDFYGDFLRNR